jgi:hypothetical protein
MKLPVLVSSLLKSIVDVVWLKSMAIVYRLCSQCWITWFFITNIPPICNCWEVRCCNLSQSIIQIIWWFVSLSNHCLVSNKSRISAFSCTIVVIIGALSAELEVVNWLDPTFTFDRLSRSLQPVTFKPKLNIVSEPFVFPGSDTNVASCRVLELVPPSPVHTTFCMLTNETKTEVIRTQYFHIFKWIIVGSKTFTVKFYISWHYYLFNIINIIIYYIRENICKLCFLWWIIIDDIVQHKQL